MSQEVFIRGLFSGLFSLGFAWVVFARYDREVGSESSDDKRERYMPYIPSIILPVFLLFLSLMYAIVYGPRHAAQLTISMCFSIFLHISFFYVILMLIMPLLRRFISARACAMLWMIPNYLYITQQDFMALPKPWLVIPAPGKWVWIIFGIWLVGFVAFLLWKIIEHFIFRRKVLKDSEPITDPETLEIWSMVIADARIKKPKFRLCSSPNVNTPLSVGLFRRSVRVILPRRSYTAEDLELVLRHEIVHIGREDAWSKFFLVFCAAMCWFNPLMWLAMRKSAEDLELSCDETVLLDADESLRRKYASLLLSTAGDGRGFTSCLSASARTMRYRLRSVVRPPVNRSGALIVGAVFFLMCMTNGYVALAYEEHSGAELIYQSTDGQIDPAYEISIISSQTFEHNGFIRCRDEDTLEEYLAGLSFGRLSGNYSMSEFENQLLLIYNGPNGDFALNLRDNALSIVPLGRSSIGEQHYYALTDLDWNYLYSLIFTRSIQDTSLSFPPQLEMTIDNGHYVVPGDVKSYEYRGIQQDEEDWWLGVGDIGLIAPMEDTIRLTFFHDVSGEFTIEVRDLYGEIMRTYTSSQLYRGEFLPLESYPARYIIRATFEDDTSEIEMEYSFSVSIR